MSDVVFGAGQKIVFIGDSITDCGRREGPAAPYGNGYVHLARAFLLARYGALSLEVVNRGIGGNTVRDLAARWEQDVIAEQPAWLSVKIGINDVWRSVAGRLNEMVPLAEYESTYDALLARARERTKTRLILMEPYVIAPPVVGDVERASHLTLEEVRRLYPELRQRGVASGPEFDACLMHFRAQMDEFVGAVHRLAQKHESLLVRTQQAFDEAIVAQPPAYWAADRVHPGAPGHAVIARAWLRTVGYGDV